MAIDVQSDAPIFIVGCERSGTTLLRDLLRSHPRLTFPDESGFIPLFYRAYGDPQNAAEACELAEQILRLRWVRLWQLGLEPASFSDCRSFREVLCRLYETYARHENKPRWGDKTPRYVREIPLLMKLFPGARILHIYRDGRDVALSFSHVWFGPCNTYTAAGHWKRCVNAGRRAAATLPRGTYMEVRYETLLERPRETMQQVCEFIGEAFDEAVLRPSKMEGDPRLHPFPEKGSRGALMPTNFGKWKTRMPVKDRVLFESVAGDLLETLGYETEGRIRRISSPERVAWHLHHQLWRRVMKLAAMSNAAFFSTYLQVRRARARAERREATP
jgi:hypothetical protein